MANIEDRREPGLNLSETQDYHRLVSEMERRRQDSIVNTAKKLWLKSIEESENQVREDAKKLSAHDSEKETKNLIEQNPSGLPTWLKSILNRAVPGLFPQLAIQILDNALKHESQQRRLEENRQEIESQKRLFKDYNLTIPTSNSFFAMDKFRKVVVGKNDFFPGFQTPETKKLKEYEYKIADAKNFKQENLAAYREQELALLNNSSRLTGYLPELSFADPNKINSINGFLLTGSGNTSQNVFFDGAYWAILQAQDKNYLVPRPSGNENYAGLEINYTFSSGQTKIFLSSKLKNAGKLTTENSITEDGEIEESEEFNNLPFQDRDRFISGYYKPYYSHEFPNMETTVDRRLEKELERREHEELQRIIDNHSFKHPDLNNQVSDLVERPRKLSKFEHLLARIDVNALNDISSHEDHEHDRGGRSK